MSNTIDERVVEMRFDNKNFEKNVQTSMSTLDKLKQSLKLDGAAKGLENVENTARDMNFEKLLSGVEALQDRFSAFGIIGMRVLENLTDSMMRLADKTIDFLTNSIVQGGIRRAMNLENAHFQLQGLLRDEEAVAAVMKNVNDSVNGTAYSLDSAAKVASQLAASGMRAGDEMYTSLRAVAGVAAMTNSEYDDIGKVFTTVAGNGRLMGDQLLQLSSRGLNAAATISEYFNGVNSGSIQANESITAYIKEMTGGLTVAEADIREFVSKGKINFEVFASAMDDAFGEHAKKANETFTGAMSNVKSALARIGAGFVSPLIEQNGALVQLLNTVRERVNDVKKGLVFDDKAGNINALSKQFTDFIIKIANTANSYLSDLDLTKHLEVFYNLLESLKNVFKGLGTIIKPIAKAFRDIFPPATIDNVVKFSEKLKELTSRFKLNEKDAENLRSTFKGLFAILDIGRQAIRAIISAILPAAPALGEMGSGILKVTGTIGEWIAALDEAVKENETFTKAINKIKETIQKFIEFVSPAFDVIKNAIGSGIDAIREFAKTHFSAPDTSGLDVIKNIFSGIASVLKPLGPVILQIGEAIGNALHTLGSKISEGLGETGFIDLLNGGLLVGIGVGINKFIESLSVTISRAGGMFSGVYRILFQVKNTLITFQAQLKANILIKIAAAIAILTASLVVLSLIDPEKLTKSLGILTGLFADLFGSMAAFEKLMGASGFASMGRATTGMLKMSLAVLILSSAMKKLASVDQDDLNNALVAVTGLIADLVAASLALSKWGGKVQTSATGMILFAVAIRILAGAVKKLGSMDYDVLAQGLEAVGIVMAELAGFMIGAKFGSFKSSQGVAMIELAAALLILQKAVSAFGNMDVDAMLRGLSGVGIVLAELAAFVILTGDSKKMVSTATGMVILGAAMLIFANAVKSFAEMSWDELGRGLTGMAVALAAIAVAMNNMPTNTPIIAAGMVILGAALKIVASAMAEFGAMSWEELARSLILLAGSLAVIAVSLKLMTGTASGSASMLVMSAALAVLVGVLKKAGKMSWEEIGKGLVLLAGSFAVIGAAGLLLGPVAPVILAFAAAIAVLGVGIVGIGAGILMLSSGLAILATSGAAGIAVLVLAIEAILDLIPVFIVKIGEGIIAVLDMVARVIPSIGNLVVQIGATVIDTLRELIPKLLQLLSEVLIALDEHLPDILEHLVNICLTLLNTIEENIGKIVSIVVKIISELLLAISEKAPELMEAAVDVVINLIEGLAKGIEENAERIHKAIIDLCIALITTVCTFFGIHSPSTVFADIGKNLILGLINGILAIAKTLLSTMAELLVSLLSAIKEKLVGFKNKGAELMTYLKNGIVSKVAEIKNKIKELIVGVLNGIREKIADFKNMGINIINGLKQGIIDAKNKIIDTMKSIASSAIDTVKSFLGINSPSRVFAEIGENIDKGFIVGLETLADDVSDASRNVGEEAVKGMSDSLMALADIAAQDIDSEPTITPVLDLSNIESGMRTLDRMLFTQRSVALGADTAASVNAGIAQRNIQNGTADGGNSNDNTDVVSAIEDLRRDVSSLAELIGKLKLVTDTGALVGELLTPMNYALGMQAKYDTRGN